jgi:hypothetical protein
MYQINEVATKIPQKCYLLLLKKKNATWNKKMLATATSNFENFPPYKNGYQVASIIGKGQKDTSNQLF